MGIRQSVFRSPLQSSRGPDCTMNRFLLFSFYFQKMLCSINLPSMYHVPLLLLPDVHCTLVLLLPWKLKKTFITTLTFIQHQHNTSNSCLWTHLLAHLFNKLLLYMFISLQFKIISMKWAVAEGRTYLRMTLDYFLFLVRAAYILYKFVKRLSL